MESLSKGAFFLVALLIIAEALSSPIKNAIAARELSRARFDTVLLSHFGLGQGKPQRAALPPELMVRMPRETEFDYVFLGHRFGREANCAVSDPSDSFLFVDSKGGGELFVEPDCERILWRGRVEAAGWQPLSMKFYDSVRKEVFFKPASISKGH